MNFDACIKKITKYFASENAQPLLVNVQNGMDLDRLKTYFDVDGNEFIDASRFCNKDELPRIEVLLADISMNKKNCFLLGLTSFLRFYGEEEIRKHLANIVNMTISGHVVVVVYQCDRQLSFSDPRLSRSICLLDGDAAALPKLVFVSNELSVALSDYSIVGIDAVAKEIESPNVEKIFVVTTKHKDMYPQSIYSITDMSNAYEVISGKDATLSHLDEVMGTSSQWDYLLSLIDTGKTFIEICNREFGNYQSLEIAISSYSGYSEQKKWLYFIALKLFGAANNSCLDIAASHAATYLKLIREVYRGILEKEHTDKDFDSFYQTRKSLLIAFGNPVDEIVDFCKVVVQKEEKAIYYLTDNTRQEKELIFTLLEKYYQSMEKRGIEKILSVVYPDLCAYIRDYRYNIPLLDKYFSLYT